MCHGEAICLKPLDLSTNEILLKVCIMQVSKHIFKPKSNAGYAIDKMF